MSARANEDEQIAQLATLCGGDFAEATRITVTLGLCGRISVEKVQMALQHLERSHTVGPIVDPTSYRQALQSNRLDNSISVFRALLDLLLVLQKVQAEAVEHADPAPAGKDVPA